MEPPADPLPPATFEPPPQPQPQPQLQPQQPPPLPSYFTDFINPGSSPSPDLNNISAVPTYDEMIETAIRALNEEKGSSRQAIAKYIENSYSNLLPSHSALLTHHLKRLKNNGRLLMEKHSYKLPGSFPHLSSPPLPPAAAPAAPPPPGGPRRGPGRPPKAKPQAQLNNGPESEIETHSVFATGSVSEPEPHPVYVTGAGSEPESVFVSLGLVDVPTVVGVAKRGRGRPPKIKGPMNGGSTAGGPLSVRKARGRPPRPKSVSAPMGQAGLKRGRGRPPKTGLGSLPRSRGRPKKDAKMQGRPRGRPPKIAAATSVGGGEVLVPVGGGVLPMKRRGRPPKVGGAKKPKKLTGRPMGRPRKNAKTAMEVAVVQQQQQQQLMAYEDLKTKLEHVQSRIQLAVSVVKPYLNADIAVGAVGALQELEQLAAMDLSAPLSVQGQELLQN